MFMRPTDELLTTQVIKGYKLLQILTWYYSLMSLCFNSLKMNLSLSNVCICQIMVLYIAALCSLACGYQSCRLCHDSVSQSSISHHRDWVQSQANPCGVSGGLSGKQQGFSPSTSVFLCQDHFTKHSTIMNII